MNKIMYMLPVLILGWLVYLQISKPVENIDIRMISMNVPEFSLQEISLTYGKTGRIITEKDLPHKVIMINFFASWCTACHREHKQLMLLAEKHNLTIYGIAYNDTEKSLIRSFRHRPDPYEKIAITPTIYNLNEWDIHSMPASFLIDANGTIRYHHKEAILEQHIEDIILPIIKEISQ